MTKEELIEKLTDLSTNEVSSAPSERIYRKVVTDAPFFCCPLLQKYMEGAKQLQAKLLAEDGTAIAVELIEATISK